MLNDYSKIASRYDFLSRLVFSRSQVNAQISQLKQIPKNSTVLIAGGGTGWILEEIAKIHPSGLHILYVEISSAMLALSKKRNCGLNKVDFIHSAIEVYITDHVFDVIITPFLFDNFSPQRAEIVFNKLHQQLINGGFWFMVDFSLQKKQGIWWKKIFLKVMYTFFNIISQVEANKLIDMSAFFLEANYIIFEDQFYYGKFIRATIYQK
ncbi:class I SAM-dependent methyltransferase [Pedobacter frigidisoli]|uniref:class I SAM-dependent methyltransferase n=1 Tax=Pedobacter frigidisoli TaxID=2530455 RepID=UPI00292FA7EF|nr:class I SAM-dependent methyltransferase [Pedobacter frigidisoli]